MSQLAEFESPLISVVIPTRNRRRLVVDALESVRGQTHRPLEVLVIDDGSDDDTAQAVEAWRLRHASDELQVRYQWIEPSGGNAARNRGIQLGRGNWVAFLDSDDQWDPEKLARQRRRVQANPLEGAVYCGFRHTDVGQGQLIRLPKHEYPTGDLLRQLLIRDVTAPTSTYLVRRDLLEAVGGFDESLEARQDWDLWIRLAAETQIGCVAETLVSIREHPGPRTYTDPLREVRAYRQILAKYRHLEVRFGRSTRCQRYAAYYRRLTRVYSHRQLSRLRALGYGVQSIACWPFAFDSYAALAGVLLPRDLRGRLNRLWNGWFENTALAIRSH